jgi:hypothetical protein
LRASGAQLTTAAARPSQRRGGALPVLLGAAVALKRVLSL